MEELFRIGYLTRTHGTRGELSMNFTDDVWDRADADYLFLVVDGIPVPFFLEEWRFRSDSVALLKFQDIDDADTAQEFVGCDVMFPTSLVPEATPEDEYSWRSFTGWTLVDARAGNIGTIDHVDDSTQNILFEVGDLILPANEDFIRNIDPKARVITMTLPEGILEL